jgi:hypothetical protein
MRFVHSERYHSRQRAWNRITVTSDNARAVAIKLARFARVDALVSGDPHLLELRSILPVRCPHEFLDSLETG